MAAFVDASFNKNQCARGAFYCSYRRSSDNCKAAGRAELQLARAVALDLHQLRNMDFSTHGVCGEEGEGNEGSGADGEALAVGGSGVAGGVEGVSALTHVLTEPAYLGNAAGVVADGAVSVDGEADGEGGEHAEGGHAMMATPYWEASLKEMHTVAARARTGTMVDCMPRARPWMILVAAPVRHDSATSRTERWE